MRINFIRFSAGLVAALATVPAFAADPTVEAPVGAGFSWSGHYAGLQAGYAWGNSTADYFATLPPGETPIDPDGGLIGGYVGYNYQFTNNVVLGVDTDIAYANVDGTGTFIDSVFGPLPGETDSGQLNWSAAVRGRVGFAMGRLLPYVAGGVAFGDVDHQTVSANPAFNGSWSKTYTGYTVGAGAEFALTDMVILRGEYRFTDFGSHTFSNADPETPHDVDLSTSDVRFGVAVKF